MPPFDDIGFLLMDIAKMCNVDAARIVTGDAIAASLTARDHSGFHLVASEAFQAPDGTQAQHQPAPPHRARAGHAAGDGAARADAVGLVARRRATGAGQRASASLRTAATGAAVPSTSR
jgi:hypothetical protein